MKNVQRLYDYAATLKIAQQLEFVEVNPPASRSEILDQLENGDITVQEAEKKLRGKL